MSVESIEIISQNLSLEVQNGVTHTLSVTDGIQLELTLGVMGLQGPQGAPGVGDMQKATYDTTNNGIVDAAESVPWTGVTGKPSTFTPSAHTHIIGDVTGLQTALDGKEPADITILKEADIGTLVQAYDADLTSWAGIAPSTKLDTTGGIASGITLNDGYTEEVFAISGTTPALSPSNGSIQTWTLTANSTPTAGTWNNGQSICLMIDDGTASTVDWAALSITWKTGAGSAPTLNTSGYTAITLWKVSGVIYGARVGDA